MAKIDVVRDFLTAEMDLDRADRVLSDDFEWEDSTGQTQGKAAYLGMGHGMMAAFPDIDFIVDEIHEEDDGVIVTGHWKGTFENDFDLSALGVGVIPATGNVITWPPSTSRWAVEGDHITRAEEVATGPDVGLAGFLKPLGVNVGG